MKDFKNLGPQDFLRIFWRRRWYFLASFLLVSIGTGVVGWRLPDVYRSATRILVESALVPQDYVRPSDRSTPEERIAAIRDQLQSRSFMERMIQEFQLFGYGTSNKFSMDDAVAAISKSIQVASTSRNTFTISYAATDPQFAQTFTRRLAESLIQANTSSRKTKAAEADQFLDEQLRPTERNLAAQEEKIKQFKTAHLGELPEQGVANMNALSGLHAQLAAVENALQHARDQRKLLDFRAQEQKRLNVLSRNLTLPGPSSPAADAKPQAPPAGNALLSAKQALLAELTARYTAKHPDVVRLSKEVEDLKQQSAYASKKPGSETAELTPLGEGEIKPASGGAESPGLGTDAMFDIEAAEIKVEAEAINNEIAKREKEKEAILGQIKTFQGRLNLAPSLEQELVALSRDHEVLKAQYANLQSKKFQSQMTADLEANKNNETYRVVDEANLPERPAFPNRIQIALMGIGAGFLLGIGAAFGREYLDATLGTEHEAQVALNIPVLVSISEIPQKEGRRLIGSGQTAKSA